MRASIVDLHLQLIPIMIRSEIDPAGRSRPLGVEIDHFENHYFTRRNPLNPIRNSFRNLPILLLSLIVIDVATREVTQRCLLLRLL